jgi:mannose-1-phosphate guanylyltransferase
MMYLDLHPVVLCGESGSRLWPMSRASYHKQLHELVNAKYGLLQSTLILAAALHGAQPPLLVCNIEHRFPVAEQCHAIQAQPNTHHELVGRNTALTIALAALHLAEHPIQPNTGKVTPHIAEAQLGDYLGENDILRFEDAYARSPLKVLQSTA